MQRARDLRTPITEAALSEKLAPFGFYCDHVVKGYYYLVLRHGDKWRPLEEQKVYWIDARAFDVFDMGLGEAVAYSGGDSTPYFVYVKDLEGLEVTVERDNKAFKVQWALELLRRQE